jgi:hypothetical protein
MKSILIINDNSAAATHAAEFALYIAQKMEANIILANTCKRHSRTYEVAHAGSHAENRETSFQTNAADLLSLKNLAIEFKPQIEEFDWCEMDENKMAGFINRNDVWMMVKGMPVNPAGVSSQKNLNAKIILNKVLCPLLLVPENWEIKTLERIAYIADLRYCRVEIVRYLAQMAKPWRALVSIAQLTAKGLPDMAEKYALSVFNEAVCPNVNYDLLYFNNVKEKDFTRVVDVMINGLHNDLLVLVNHHFHIKEILGPYITDTLPEPVSVPVLIFPF